MAGQGILHFRNPPIGFRPGRDGNNPDKFETLSVSFREDTVRADGLEHADLPALKQMAALDLARRLREGVESHSHPDTLASHLRMRLQRYRTGGQLWYFADQQGLDDAAAFTLMPTGMWVPAADLHQVNPRNMMKRLRNDQDRTGVTQASGYLMAGLHAEFDVNRLGYDFHYHGVAGGEKVQALENLREMVKYKAPRSEPWEAGLPDRPRIRITKQPLYDLPQPLTYVLQSSIPHRPTTAHPDGSVTRSDWRYRIPEPWHSEWLLWMDRWSLPDLLLLNGMRADRHGFCLTPPKS